MKGTRLWQDTGSPLISGRSRRERPFWHQSLLAWVIGVAAVALFVLALGAGRDLPRTDIPGMGVRGLGAVLVGSTAYAAVPSLIGGVFGVWLARKMGWRRPWVAGAAVAVLAGLLWLVLSVTAL